MKCPSCKSEWNIGPSKSMQNMTEYPYCHAPLDNAQEDSPDESTAAEQLRRFVSNALKDFPNEEGAAIYKSSELIKALKDLFGKFPKELRRSRIAYEAKIPERLYSADKKSSEEQMDCMRECVYVLKDGWDMEENAAKEIVALLVAGLGWNISDGRGNFYVKQNSSAEEERTTFLKNLEMFDESSVCKMFGVGKKTLMNYDVTKLDEVVRARYRVGLAILNLMDSHTV